MSRFVILVAAGALALGACKSESKSKTEGLPPATNWNANAPGPGAPQTAPGGRVKATGPNPHAGADQGNPHAGLGIPAPGAGAGQPPAGADMPGPDPNRPIDPNAYLEGTLEVDDKVKTQVVAGAVVFFSVKVADPKSGAGIGMPLAVDRKVANGFPLAFRITERNAMTQGTKLAGDVVITAWTDKDLDASTKQPGDVIGTVRAKIPAKGLKLVLDTVQQ